jgi:hypothetical protein
MTRLEHPELRKDNRIVKAYADAQKSDSGESFTLPQMEEIQGEMVRVTADVHDEVGGEKQEAVLEGGHISKFNQPNFSEPSKPFGLGIVQCGSLSSSIDIRGNIVTLFDSVHFNL